MQDEGEVEKQGISEEDWLEIKKRWAITHEDWDKDEYSKSQKNEFRYRAKYNKLLFLKERATLSEEGLEELFKAVKVRWDADFKKRDGYLLKEIQKAKKYHEIYEARRKKLEKEKIEELTESEEFTLESAYNCIASLELAGASIPDYEKLTLGKYDALNATLAKRNGKRPNTR